MQKNDSKKTYAERIYTYGGITKENMFADGKTGLHIGPGTKALPGATTIDILPLAGVEVVHDLDVFPWPFEESSFDVIFAHSVFEHLDNQIAVMKEMSRILKGGGRIVIAVPHFRCTDAFTDATHKHFFTTQSLDYYIEGKALAQYQYSKERFIEKGFWFGWPQTPRNPLTRLFKWFILRYPHFYDTHLSLLLPMKIIVWELEVIKE
jgi:SAM-dependent methyltransferase